MFRLSKAPVGAFIFPFRRVERYSRGHIQSSLLEGSGATVLNDFFLAPEMIF